MIPVDPDEERLQKIREIFTKEYGIEPGYAKALYLRRTYNPDGYRLEAIGLGGVTQQRLQRSIEPHIWNKHRLINSLQAYCTVYCTGH
jgi:hypothetical protein